MERYKNFNNPQGNSPITDLNSQYTNSGTSLPESEDLNRDNSLNETESYYQYRVRLTPNMVVGQNNIASTNVVNVKLANGRTQAETWYQFKIHIKSYEQAVT